MIRRTLALLAVLSLSSCASTGASEAAAPEGTVPALELLTYRTGVREVPAGTEHVRLALRVPDEGATRAVRMLRVSGLVGNAPFELALDQPSANLADEHTTVAWSTRADGGVAVRELVIETSGRPVELGLTCARPAGSGETGALAEALARLTTITADGRALESVSTRLEPRKR